MNKKHDRKAKIAIAALLTTTSLGYASNNVFANDETSIQREEKETLTSNTKQTQNNEISIFIEHPENYTIVDDMEFTCPTDGSLIWKVDNSFIEELPKGTKYTRLSKDTKVLTGKIGIITPLEGDGEAIQVSATDVLWANAGKGILKYVNEDGSLNGNIRFVSGGKIVKADGTEVEIPQGSLFTPEKQEYPKEANNLVIFINYYTSNDIKDNTPFLLDHGYAYILGEDNSTLSDTLIEEVDEPCNAIFIKHTKEAQVDVKNGGVITTRHIILDDQGNEVFAETGTIMVEEGDSIVLPSGRLIYKEDGRVEIADGATLRKADGTEVRIPRASYYTPNANQQQEGYVTITGSLDKTYDGQAVTNPTIEKPEGSGEVTFEWYTADGTKLDSAPVNAGSYKVKAILAANDQYTEAEAEKSFTIEKANQVFTVTADKENIKVTEATNLVVNGAQGSINYTSSDTAIATVDTNGKVTAVSVGTVEITVTAAETENYKGGTQTVTITVTKADPIDLTGGTVTITEQPVYNGNAQTPAVRVEVGGETLVQGVDYEISYENNINAGEASVTIQGIGDYTGTLTQKFIINKGTTSIEITNTLDKEYDGQAVSEPTVNVKGSTGSKVIEWYKKEESTSKVVTWKKLTEAPSEVGTYKVVVSVEEDENYTGASTEKEFSIREKETVTPEVVPTPPNGGTITNPDGGTIIVKPGDNIESNGPVVENPDGSIIFPGGGAVTKPDGSEEVIQPGGVLNPTQPEVVPTPPNGGTITNPDGGTIIVKPGDNIESNGPVVENPDGSIIFPGGGAVTKPDGSEEVIQPGGVLNPTQPEVVPTPPNGGTITNPDGTPGPEVNPGDNIESNGPTESNPDGSITFPEGGTITKPDGSVEVIQPGAILRPNNPSDEITETPGEGIDGVQTGDRTQVGFWATLAGLSTGLLFFLKKKKQIGK